MENKVITTRTLNRYTRYMNPFSPLIAIKGHALCYISKCHVFFYCHNTCPCL